MTQRKQAEGKEGAPKRAKETEMQGPICWHTKESYKNTKLKS